MGEYPQGRGRPARPGEQRSRTVLRAIAQPLRRFAAPPRFNGEDDCASLQTRAAHSKNKTETFCLRVHEPVVETSCAGNGSGAGAGLALHKDAWAAPYELRPRDGPAKEFRLCTKRQRRAHWWADALLRRGAQRRQPRDIPSAPCAFCMTFGITRAYCFSVARESSCKHRRQAGLMSYRRPLPRWSFRGGS